MAALSCLVMAACSGGGDLPAYYSLGTSVEDVLPDEPAGIAGPAQPSAPSGTGGGTADAADTGTGAGGGMTSGSGTQVSPGDVLDGDTATERPQRPPSVIALADGGTLLHELPELVFVDTLADTGVQIGYTQEVQPDSTDTGFIEDQWEYMQACLGETGVPPLIVLVDGDVSPLTRDDDVLRFIDGSEVATSSVSLAGTVIQVSVADFDGSYGVPGFNLRQIIGRSLWTAAGLPERDYPTTCARVISPDL